MDEKLENLLKKVEDSFEQLFKRFEEKPVNTGIRVFILYWIFKKIYKDIKS